MHGLAKQQRDIDRIITDQIDITRHFTGLMLNGATTKRKNRRHWDWKIIHVAVYTVVTRRNEDNL